MLRYEREREKREKKRKKSVAHLIEVEVVIKLTAWLSVDWMGS